MEPLIAQWVKWSIIAMAVLALAGVVAGRVYAAFGPEETDKRILNAGEGENAK